MHPHDSNHEQPRRVPHRRLVRKRRAAVPAIALGFLLVGQTPAAAGSAVASERHCVGVLVDRSGSYEGIDAARRLAGGLVAQLRGGDSVLVRWISDHSYDPRDLVIDETIPTVETVRNQFNRRERARVQKERRRLVQTKRDLLALLARTPAQRSQFTDVWGAIRAAQEWRDATPCDSTSFVVVSDLVHNRGVIPPLRLEGVVVQVAGFEHAADFEETEKVRRAFVSRVERAGGRVYFLPPGRSPSVHSPRDTGTAR